ncbi:hypothetical protein CWE13_04910 [Aliidiomarina shirensis]|uniref:4-alpha-L-fucosyltransferase n=1 Tax=Aliidiomarina shirensis TaxID=1048642 RepID=A0A432WU85_9GAMM|nr:TDP-N-acetylfucosamine:lipid II N-acetylfucosaminyltransferase [Aliidiomarina shirensis]RUO37307.1 hypothetical protein CWE13_04910 [Aliidiomarina shirensis]
MKIAHIFSDPKFIHGAYQSFDAVAPGASTYFYDGERDIPESLDAINPVKFELNKENIQRLAEFNVWVIHGLSGNRLKILRYKKRHQRVVWVGLGYDYYDLIFPNRLDLFEESTEASAPIPKEYTLSFTKFFSFNGVKYIAMKFGILKLRKLLKMRRVDIFCPVLNSEYEMVMSRYKPFLPKFMDWNYGSSSEILMNFIANSDTYSVQRTSVLIGNSATPSNNHLEVFELINRRSLFSSFDIIVSLAYGDEEYKNWLNAIGQNYFGERYKPFERFVPVEDYLLLISTCSHVILNHRRQQAGANVVFALALGARVVMNSVSPLYKEWLERGALINSLDELEAEPDKLELPLTQEEISLNRKVVLDHFNPDVFKEKTRSLLEELEFRE